MRFLFLVICFGMIHCRPGSIPEKSTILHSEKTGDDYTIEIKMPAAFDVNSTYHLVYVADGSIGLGDYIHGRDSSWKADLPDNCIVITIGHIGDYNSKRRRDFIPSDAGGYQDENFGHAEKFYAFLKHDLIPEIEKNLTGKKSRGFVGHSFSGLFCLYAALQNDQLFDHYFAISPSVWANDEELVKIENRFFDSGKKLNADIHIYVGGLEILNKVLSSSKYLYKTMESRKYPETKIVFEVIPYANHFSVRKPAIDRILNSYNTRP